MKEIELNDTYTYKDIELFANNNNLTLYNYGTSLLGEEFICLTNDNHTYSFVLYGYTVDNSYYKCIFKY